MPQSRLMQGQVEDFSSEERRKIGLILAVFVLLIVAMIVTTSWQSINEARALTEHHDAREIDNALARFKAGTADFLAASDDWDDEMLEADAPGAEAAQAQTETAHWHRQVPRGTRARARMPLGLSYQVRQVEADGAFDDIWLLDRGFRPKVQFSIGDAADNGHALPPLALLARLAALAGNDDPPVAFARNGGDVRAIAIAPIPDDSEFQEAYPGLQGGWIAVTRKLGGAFIQETAAETQIGSLRLAISDTELAVGSSHKLDLRGPEGTRIGQIVWDSTIEPFDILKGKLPMILAVSAAFVFMAISLLRRAMISFRALNRMARIDPLSRLPNRASLLIALRRRVNASASSALALIDLDGFKQINDHHGHGTGDDVIRFVAANLKKMMPPGAYVARLGGDEFAVLFSGIANRGEVTESIQAFLDSLADPADIGGHKLKIGASIGLSFFTGYLRAPEVLRRADIAMYTAKQGGKGQWSVFKRRMDEQRLEKVRIKDQLEGATSAGQISVVYQPIYDARSGGITSLEALARWHSPELGDVSADVFIPIAEEFGLIGMLGQHILSLVLKDLAILPPFRIALNVSAAQISAPDFEMKFKDALRQHRVAPNLFELEVTETHLLSNSDLLHQSIHSLGKIGVRHILDDFGSGYASIGFLRKFPFAAVKIDRSIIAECGWNEKARAVLAAVVTLAHSQDMEVIAEGVETAEQADVARAAGCDHLQGWLFGKGVPAQAIAASCRRGETLTDIAA